MQCCFSSLVSMGAKEDSYIIVHYYAMHESLVGQYIVGSLAYNASDNSSRWIKGVYGCTWYSVIGLYFIVEVYSLYTISTKVLRLSNNLIIWRRHKIDDHMTIVATSNKLCCFMWETKHALSKEARAICKGCLMWMTDGLVFDSFYDYKQMWKTRNNRQASLYINIKEMLQTPLVCYLVYFHELRGKCTWSKCILFHLPPWEIYAHSWTWIHNLSIVNLYRPSLWEMGNTKEA